MTPLDPGRVVSPKEHKAASVLLDLLPLLLQLFRLLASWVTSSEKWAAWHRETMQAGLSQSHLCLSQFKVSGSAFVFWRE